MLTRETLTAILPNVRQSVVPLYLPRLEETFVHAACTTPLRIAMVLAQCGHESKAFTRFEENLNYSAEGLLATWPNRYTPARAAEHARNPELIADAVYSRRLGNGPPESGDGWRYRGRGAVQITGRDNYSAFSDYAKAGISFVSHPELVSDVRFAFRTIDWYWNAHDLNRFADARDVRGCRRAINGGEIGLAEVRTIFDQACKVLGA